MVFVPQISLKYGKTIIEWNYMTNTSGQKNERHAPYFEEVLCYYDVTNKPIKSCDLRSATTWLELIGCFFFVTS